MKVKEFIENVNKEIAKDNERYSKKKWSVSKEGVGTIVEIELKKVIKNSKLEEKISLIKNMHMQEGRNNGISICDECFIEYKRKRMPVENNWYDYRSYQLTIVSVEAHDELDLEKNLEDIISNYIDKQLSVKNSKKEKTMKVKKLIEEKMTLDEFREIYKMIYDGKYDYEHKKLLEKELGLDL